MARLKPSLRPTETYTEPNFLRLHTAPAPGVDESSASAARLTTIEHLAYSAVGDDRGWKCLTIVDSEAMTQEDAVFIARSYAAEHDIPVIYECHSE
jgi:hypothetical protein